MHAAIVRLAPMKPLLFMRKLSRDAGLAYEKRHRPVAWLIVVLICVGTASSIRGVQLALIGILLVLVLEVLFDVRDRVLEPAPVWFDSFSRGIDDAADEVRRRLAKNRDVRIRWIGVTMVSGWPIVQGLLLEAERTRGRLHAEVALLDPGWLERGELPADYRPLGARSTATLSTIDQFIQDPRGQAVNHGGSGVAVYTYSHRPTWHALLIDDDRMYFSPCDPRDFVLAGPQSGAEVVSSENGGAALARVNSFKAWWAIIAESDPHLDSSTNGAPHNACR